MQTRNVIGAFNESGQSLISVLVSVGILGIVILTTASVFESQNRESKALAEKLGAMDLEKTLISTLADGTVCQYVLNNPTSLTFDSTKVSPTTPQVINLSGPLYASINSGPPPTPGPVVAQIGQPASGYSSSLIVKSIQLSIVSGAGNTYLGNWIVGFDGNKMVRAIRPVSVSTKLTVNTSAPNSPTSAVITGCQMNSFFPTPLCSTSATSVSAVTSVSCPSPNQFATSCMTILDPNGDRVCDSAVNGNGCTAGGCTAAPPGQTWNLYMTCCSF